MTELGRYIPDEIPGDFWRLIEKCQGNKHILKLSLMEMSDDDVLRFCWNYEEAAGQIATLYADLTAFSEDTIDDICRWVVAQGEAAYTKVWDDAEQLITTDASPYGQIQRDPGLLDTAMNLYKARIGKSVPPKRHDRFV